MFDDERHYFYFGDGQARKQLSCLHKHQFSLSPHIYINKVKVQALNEAAGYSKFCYVFPLLYLKELCSFCFHNPLLSCFPLTVFPFYSVLTACPTISSTGGSIRGTVADPSPGAAGLWLKTLPGFDLETCARAEWGENVPRERGKVWEPKLEHVLPGRRIFCSAWIVILCCSTSPCSRL